MYPQEFRYDKEHTWMRVDSDAAVVGISHFAQDQLGEIVYVDLPAVGDEVVAGEIFGEVESVKSVSDLYAPVSGEIVKVNDVLDDAPETVNEDCYGEGWMIEVRMSDPSEADGLMSSVEYEEYLADGA